MKIKKSSMHYKLYTDFYKSKDKKPDNVCEYISDLSLMSIFYSGFLVLGVQMLGLLLLGIIQVGRYVLSDFTYLKMSPMHIWAKYNFLELLEFLGVGTALSVLGFFGAVGLFMGVWKLAKLTYNYFKKAQEKYCVNVELVD